jgi:hypothetical protein
MQIVSHMPMELLHELQIGITEELCIWVDIATNKLEKEAAERVELQN